MQLLKVNLKRRIIDDNDDYYDVMFKVPSINDVRYEGENKEMVELREVVWILRCIVNQRQMLQINRKLLLTSFMEGP